MNLFFKYDSKSWFFLTKNESKNWIFFFKNISQRTFFYDSKDWIFSLIWLKELNSFEMTHRVQPLFMNLFSIWLKELKSFLQYDSKSSTFLVFQHDSKNWTFFFLQFDSKNCVFFWYDSKGWTLFWRWLKELNLFLSMTQRIEPPFQKMNQ